MLMAKSTQQKFKCLNKEQCPILIIERTRIGTAQWGLKTRPCLKNILIIRFHSFLRIHGLILLLDINRCIS